ncbi:MAG: glycogen/starch/alpha-glucan phosphorylase [Puniceicoccaceae bacterium]
MPAKKSSLSPSAKRSSAAKKVARDAIPGATDVTTAEIKESILSHLEKTLARDTHTATRRDWWIATSKAVQDRILTRFIDTMDVHNRENVRRVYYLSLEYLMGRLFRNNIFNAGLFEQVSEAVAELGLDLDELASEENDMGLGNGGLGRLAACFLDSLATLDLPAIGYGIHYEFGLFQQQFEDGHQIEGPDHWEKFGNPWEIIRPEYVQTVRLYGRVENRVDEKGDFKPAWVDTRSVNGIPFDVPICGFGTRTVNFLRLWESKASEEFDFQVFNQGGYVEAVHDKAIGETISKVLYPNDATESGKELRLVQQYFFVCCSLQDIIRRYHKKSNGWDEFPAKVAIQLNDTHPAVATAELMRILVDEHDLAWEKAWEITRRTFAYTNHTLLPEALERWSVPLFERVLPRHLQIIYEINRRFLEEEVEAMWPGDDGKKRELSLIEEGEPRMIRMAYLSVVASHAVNGVAALHTQLLRSNLFRNFDEMYPGKFQNKTNGITPRRWLLACNPELSSLLTSKVGGKWTTHLDELRAIEPYAEEADFRKEYLAVKHTKKEQLAEFIERHLHIGVDPSAIFDTQVKRLHEYKRQHLNLLHVLTLYHRILHDPDYDMVPRVFIFAAKAAPGYFLAKNIIRAINKVGEKINHDPRVEGRIKVAFLPNYGVTLAEKIIPAADLSEQISTAGKEASGTGNMKFALNGALTIGTLDGANVEIREEVGDENIFIFGLEAHEVTALKASGYNPRDFYERNAELRTVLDWLRSDAFTPGETGAFSPLVDSLLEGGDPFLVCADFEAYLAAQARVDAAFRDREHWARMAILNTARVGKFSSDRTIRQYADEIWHLPPVRVEG